MSAGKRPIITVKRKLARVALGLALALTEMTGIASAQQPEPNQPPELSPKTPSFRTQPSRVLDQMLGERAHNVGDDTLITPSLRGVIIVKSRDEILPSGVPRIHGFEVRDIPLLSESDFRAVVVPYLGKPLTVRGVKNLQRDIVQYCRTKHRPLVDVILPEQTVENGVIQLWFLEGKVGQVTVQTAGKKWFPDNVLRNQVRLRAGDPVDSRKLLDDLDWINRNPFRQVDAQFKQGTQLGQSDVVLLSQERFPFRFYAGYEDSGTRLTGEDRLLAGVNWGNAFGLDHQLNYQYMTDTDFEFVKAHSGSYVIPLPWRHSLIVFGSYVDAKADLGSLAPGFNQHGFSYQTSLRYNVPLPSVGQYRHETSFGFDYKVSNNNLLFGDSNAVVVVDKSAPEIGQFELGYSGSRPDQYGQTSFGFEGYFSPGDLTRNNTDSAFELLRSGARADYEYARLNAERDTRLPRDFSWVLKFTAQFTTERLLPSEELGVGGYSTVRGYDERAANGDEGWIMNNELRTPPISVFRLLPLHLKASPRTGGPTAGASASLDQLQFLGFWDYGIAHVVQAQPGEDADVTLSSVGVGFRYVISPYLSVRFDYGWQLKSIAATAISSDDSRGHVAVLLSF